MTEITVPYHLATPTIICIIGLLAILVYRKRLFTSNKLFWTSLTVFLVIYLLIVGGATYEDIYYQWDLNRYDLDKDGFFGGQEVTREQQAAMQRLINDVGRNFLIFTGLIFSFVISVAIYFAGWILKRVKGSYERNENHT